MFEVERSCVKCIDCNNNNNDNNIKLKIQLLIIIIVIVIVIIIIIIIIIIIQDSPSSFKTLGVIGGPVTELMIFFQNWNFCSTIFLLPSIQVEFVVADITTADYPPESFDVVYSRDTILHIKDKKTLFANFLVS